MADADTRELFVKQVQAILPGARLDFMDEAHTAASLVAAAIKRGATVIAAGGGDGTINAVASELLAAERLNSKPRNSELIRAEIALGVLPLGTLNHFAGDMGIPEEMEAALGVLANGRVLSVDVGTVNNNVAARVDAGARLAARNDVAVNALGVQQVTGVTVSGAGGVVGFTALARAKPDGRVIGTSFMECTAIST